MDLRLMANRRYLAGRRKEWAVRQRFDKSAQLTVRAAGSKGLADIVAVYPTSVYLIQVKYVKRGASWRDGNWRTLLTLPLPDNVHRLAYVYRRGQKEPEVFES